MDGEEHREEWRQGLEGIHETAHRQPGVMPVEKMKALIKIAL